LFTGEGGASVAREMGYDIMLDGSWRPRPGNPTDPGPVAKIKGSGARIGECLRSGMYLDAQGNVVKSK
jgi:hypothetical protein